jgi:hypothetical protein
VKAVGELRHHLRRVALRVDRQEQRLQPCGGVRVLGLEQLQPGRMGRTLRRTITEADLVGFIGVTGMTGVNNASGFTDQELLTTINKLLATSGANGITGTQVDTTAEASGDPMTVMDLSAPARRRAAASPGARTKAARSPAPRHFDRPLR